MESSGRFEWALKILRIRPCDEILEIGCGTGIAAGMIAERLVSGHITAIDRSASLIAKAGSKVRSDRIRFLVGRPGDLELPRHHYTKAFAFNVSAFWRRDAVKELGKLRELLEPRGAFYLFHQPPVSAKARVIAGKSREFLEAAGFKVTMVLFADIPPAEASCIISKPSKQGH